ncbi:MAG TPA: hypothetical protein VMU33_19705 [Burkholderiaceae bacterium]|nr:hypothetical protein [Burkholderiaceae bacterium]
MGCCGKGREALAQDLAGSRDTAPRGGEYHAPVSAADAERPVSRRDALTQQMAKNFIPLKHLGAGREVLRGKVSRNWYRFAEGFQVQWVDRRDVEHFLASGLFEVSR